MAIVYSVLIVLLFYIAFIDLRKQKISNKLCLLIWGVGISANCFLASGSGCYASIIGFFAGLLPLLILYCITGIGAGDVKLMAALGSVVGAHAILLIFYYSFLLAGSWALAYLMCKGGIKEMLYRYFRFFRSLFQRRYDNSKPAPDTVAARQIPMAPGIFLAALYVLLPGILGSGVDGNFFWN